MSFAASTAYLEPTVYHHSASAANVEPTITVSMVKKPVNTSEHTVDVTLVLPTATEIAAPLTVQHINLTLVIGMNSKGSLVAAIKYWGHKPWVIGTLLPTAKLAFF